MDAYGKVNRPAFGSGDVEVKLTASPLAAV
ncbi:hypothetical protein ACFPXP_10455 [Marinicrinis lubricantis]|uniref:Uncharacterized protein n=1 Tax=Marinicrinis lubricantis TaxID=2086470 RepID=A0ABW1IP32_9BACL